MSEQKEKRVLTHKKTLEDTALYTSLVDRRSPSKSSKVIPTKYIRIHREKPPKF